MCGSFLNSSRSKGVVMDNARSSSKYPLIPPNENRCVWMTAGILSYQLCEREFDCDHCPLDSALRTFPQRGIADQGSPSGSPKTSEKQKLLAGFLYSRKHCWIKSQDDKTVRVGIEPVLASMFVGAKSFVLPAVGDRVHANKVCAWIVLEGGTMPIAAPLDGEVCGINNCVVGNPHIICDDSYEKGWLFELVTGEDIYNQSSLFRLAEASRIYNGDQHRFQSMVANELKRHRTDAGATLPDGGQMLTDVASMLGPEKYFRVLSDAFM